MTRLPLSTCQRCGAELQRVAGSTCAPAVRCPVCRAGGDYVIAHDGRVTVRHGPAVTPASTPPLVADGGVRTDADHYGVGFGAIDDPDSTYCRHAECLVLPTDPDRELLRPCQRPALARVPRPDTDAPVGLCGYHLARYRDAYPRVWADLEADHHVNEFAPDLAVTALAQAPDPFCHGGREWKRLALDQQGHVHYVGAGEGAMERTILEVTGRFQQVRTAAVSRRTQDQYMDGVARRVGWAEIAEWVETPEGGNHE